MDILYFINYKHPTLYFFIPVTECQISTTFKIPIFLLTDNKLLIWFTIRQIVLDTADALLQK